MVGGKISCVGVGKSDVVGIGVGNGIGVSVGAMMVIVGVRVGVKVAVDGTGVLVGMNGVMVGSGVSDGGTKIGGVGDGKIGKVGVKVGNSGTVGCTIKGVGDAKKMNCVGVGCNVESGVTLAKPFVPAVAVMKPSGVGVSVRLAPAELAGRTASSTNPKQ